MVSMSFRSAENSVDVCDMCCLQRPSRGPWHMLMLGLRGLCYSKKQCESPLSMLLPLVKDKEVSFAVVSMTAIEKRGHRKFLC